MKSPKKQNQDNEILNVLIGALLFGYGWHIRGSGTSDPTIVMALFLLFLSWMFGPRKKFNYFIFGIIVLVFRTGRRGWGTFVGQAGIPGLYPGHLISYTENYHVEVAWWQGYFWLFIVGLAWIGPTTLFLGGYLLSDTKFSWKDIFSIILIYVGSAAIGHYIAKSIVPIIAPEAYNYVYLEVGSERNYNSMIENFRLAFAMIPVFLYIYFVKGDKKFVKRSSLIWILFGVGLSVADLWQMYGRNNRELGIPFWGLWEYFSGLIFGIGIMIFYNKIPKEEWNNTDSEAPITTLKPFWKNSLMYIVGHLFLFGFGMQDSLKGLINSIAKVLELNFEVHSWQLIPIILAIDLPIYILHQKRKIGKKYLDMPFHSKAKISLLILLAFSFLCYSVQFFISGRIFMYENRNIMIIIDFWKFIVVEGYLLWKY